MGNYNKRFWGDWEKASKEAICCQTTFLLLNWDDDQSNYFLLVKGADLELRNEVILCLIVSILEFQGLALGQADLASAADFA